jgi:hypothetical protein
MHELRDEIAGHIRKMVSAFWEACPGVSWYSFSLCYGSFTIGDGAGFDGSDSLPEIKRKNTLQTVAPFDIITPA